MRIAVIAPPWVPVPPPAYGGTEAVLDTLARGLLAAGHDVLLYATGDSTCEVPTAWVLERAAGMLGTGAATELRHVVNAYATIRQWQPDIIHDHTLVGPVYGERFGIPVVTTNHGPFEGELGDFYRAISPTVPVIAISCHHASTARAIRIAAVIHHGVDVDSFPIGHGDGGYALFLGRMSADKGVHRAAEVARRAGVSLRIAAKMREPLEVAYFKDHVAPLLDDRIEYVGEVGGAEKLELIAGASCLLNPLAWPEPFGMVMIESLACGTPVVATRCGSVEEIVDEGRTGFVCSTDEELVAGVRAAAALDRTDCRKAAADRFSAARMVADHVDLYEWVLAGGMNAPRQHPVVTTS